MPELWVGRDRWARRVQRGGPSGPALPEKLSLNGFYAFEREIVLSDAATTFFADALLA